MGSPHAEGLFSYASRVAEDEHEQYPYEALRWLDQWGMQQNYIPSSASGVLQDFEVLLSLVRAVSRRDVTAAVSHAVSFLGSICVWIAGSEQQKTWLAAQLLRGERISLALTERDHGGDLLSVETEAGFQEAGHCLLRGEKWLINGATQNSLVLVLARTSREGGPRGFSLVLFDKKTADPGSFACTKRVRTLGVRGADISGIRFHCASLPSSALVGCSGDGFEVVLKGLQLTRILCGTISLGAAETAFRATIDFAFQRRVYGRPVFDIPHCQRLLVQSWVDLLVCDCLLTAAARSLHCVPWEASVHSAVIKYLVPELLEHTIKQLAIVLGARYYLREEHCCGMFQKMLRDSSLVSLFDGSSVVNLYCLTTQFKALSRCWSETMNGPAKGFWPALCELATPLPELTWNNLSLSSHGQNSFLTSLPSTLQAVRSVCTSGDLAGEVEFTLWQQAGALEIAADAIMNEIARLNLGSPHAVAAEAFDRARDYCVLEGAAIVLQMWLANRKGSQRQFADGQWLAIALSRMNARLGQRTSLTDEMIEHLANQLLPTQDETPSSFLEDLVSSAQCENHGLTLNQC